MSAAEEKRATPSSAIAAIEVRVAALEALVAGAAPASVTRYAVAATVTSGLPSWWQPASGAMRMPRERGRGPQ